MYSQNLGLFSRAPLWFGVGSEGGSVRFCRARSIWPGQLSLFPACFCGVYLLEQSDAKAVLPCSDELSG
jgi:hypothetical protein